MIFFGKFEANPQSVNPIIREGIRIPIFRSDFSQEDIQSILLTLSFPFRKTDKTQKDYDPNWYLSIDSIWSEIKYPIIKHYNALYDILLEYMNDDTTINSFHLSLYKETYIGISPSYPLWKIIPVKFRNEDLTKTSFSMTRTNFP